MVVDRVGTRRSRRRLHVMAGMCVLTMLVLGATFAATGSELPNGAQYMLIALGGFLMTCTVGPAAAIVLDVTHPGLRATGAAVLSLFQNLLGLAAGPAIVGVLSDEFGLDSALTLIPAFGALAALLFVVASRSYEADRRLVGNVTDLDGACLA
jgi:MFS family permease